MPRIPRPYGRRHSDVLTIRYPAFRPDPDRDRVQLWNALIAWGCIAAMAIAMFLVAAHA